MRCSILHNPRSRHGARVAARVRELLETRHDGVEASWIALGDHESHAPVGERVIAIGGDGCVGAAGSWLLDHEARVPLGIVPAGTGNNLAMGLGIPRDTQDAVRLAVTGEQHRDIDAVSFRADSDPGAATRLFFQCATLGYPALTAGRFDRWRAAPIVGRLVSALGDSAYTLLALGGLPGLKWRERFRGYRGLRVEISLPGETITEDVFCLFLQSDGTIGGGFKPAPDARPDDGILDIVLIRGGTGESYLRVFRELQRGTATALDRTVIHRPTAGPVTLRVGEPSAIMADGDLPLPPGSVFEFHVHPRRIGIMVDSVP